MKNYYQILGLESNASADQIKRAYRKLALQFHPDKNPSPSAESFFKEINEAYQILNDGQSKALYDDLLSGRQIVVEPTEKPHRDPRYRKKPAGSPKRKSAREQMLEMMAEYMAYALNASRVAFAFCILLSVDFILPPSEKIQHIKSIERSGGRRYSSWRLQTNDGLVLKVASEAGREFVAGTEVTVYRSLFLSVPRSVVNNSNQFKAKVSISIYGNFIFFPLGMLIVSLIGLMYRKEIETQFNLGVVSMLLILFNLVLLFVHQF